MKGRVTKTGYRRNSPDVNNDYNVIPSNRISMTGVDFPVLGIDNLGNSELMYPGGEYEFQGDYVTELPAYGSGGLTQWFAEKWVDIKTGKECGRSGKDKNGRPYPACRPSKRVNKTTPKTSSEMSASEKAKFKRKKKSGKRIDYNHKRAQEGAEVPLNRSEVFNIPRTVRYENNKMVLQDKPIWDGFLDEVTITPYTQSEYAWQENRANQATGGLDPIYPVFEALTMGLKTPVTAGAKALQTAVKKAPSTINPRYFKPAEDLWYRQVGKSAIDDIAESRVIRERGEDILNSQRVYNDRILRMKGIDPDTGKPFANWETAQGQKLLGSRRPKSPYFQKGELYWGWNRKPGKGKPGRGGDADSEYLIESLLGDDAFHPAHVKGLYPDNPDKWAGDIGILKPRAELRDPAKFNLYKRNWWSGYKPVKQRGGQLPKAQSGMEVRKRNGVRKNPDGSESTHLMSREYVDGRGWVAFPTLFQNEDNTWIDMSQDSSFYPAYEEALKRGEVYDFGENVKAAIKFADEGSWKKEKYQTGRQVGPPSLTPGPIQDKVYPMVTGPVEDSLENRIVNAKSSAPKDFSRRDALLNASKRVSEGQGGRPLEVLLNMTAVMENSLGDNPKAYGRDYTRSQMSIDDNAYADLFEPRGEYDYTSSQKKGFEWLKGMGYEPAKMDSILRTDDPVAAMAAARLVYGRAPDALPNPDSPKEVYSYYMDNYNKSGALKYGDDEKHYKRFLDAYNNLYQKETGGESLEDYSVYDTYERAWLAARKKLGSNKKFIYKGIEESTST